MSELKVLTPKDIKSISVLPFQRQASLRQSLVNSMKEHGFLGTIIMIRTSLIAGSDKLYIIDGQNRFLAANYLNLPITATILTIDTTKEYLVKLIATLNSTGKQWVTEDYINAYAALGNTSYLGLINLVKECKKLSIGMIARVVTYKNPGNLRRGLFVLTDETVKAVKDMNDLLHKIPKQKVSDIEVLFKVVSSKKFDSDVFVSNYTKNIEVLTPLLPLERERIYNSWF